MTERSGQPEASNATWTRGATEWKRAEVQPVLLKIVRTGQHEGFDRVVFVFGEAVPGYRIDYVGHPIHACGSGKPVALSGEALLKVQLRPARAYTPDGVSTIEAPERAPALPVIQELKMTCGGFEADVTWVLALTDSARYRVQEVANPPRLVLDVRH